MPPSVMTATITMDLTELSHFALCFQLHHHPPPRPPYDDDDDNVRVRQRKGPSRFTYHNEEEEEEEDHQHHNAITRLLRLMQNRKKQTNHAHNNNNNNKNKDDVLTILVCAAPNTTDECPITLSTISDAPPLLSSLPRLTCARIMPCGHQFGAVALVMHFSIDGTTVRCPICRQGIQRLMNSTAPASPSAIARPRLLLDIDTLQQRANATVAQQLREEEEADTPSRQFTKLMHYLTVTATLMCAYEAYVAVLARYYHHAPC